MMKLQLEVGWSSFCIFEFSRIFWFFPSIYTPFFHFCFLFWHLLPLVLPRLKLCRTPRKYPLTTRTPDQRIVTKRGVEHVRRSADFSKKRVFGGEKGQDPKQNKHLETRHETSRCAPKNTIQCKNPRS